jgi:peptidoglycan/xylan/chitin deacetylase (PgdA/CDA1 family)
MNEPTVCLTFDFDAVSPWIHANDGARNTPGNRARGVFGAEVGVPRILEFLAERDLPATFFVPGHTVESFPEATRAIHEAGHGIQHHGWSHTPPSEFESREAELQDLIRGEEAIEEVTGEPPAGYRSPSWDYSEHTVDLLVDLGFEWCSNGMARDYTPYRVRRDHAPADEPYEQEATELVEVPVAWHRDDYPAMAFSRERQSADDAVTVRSWTDQFDWMLEHVDGGVYVLTMHPQVIGHGHRLERLREFVDHVEGTPAASFSRMDDVVRAFETAAP